MLAMTSMQNQSIHAKNGMSEEEKSLLDDGKMSIK